MKRILVFALTFLLAACGGSVQGFNEKPLPNLKSVNDVTITQTSCTGAKILRSWTHEVEKDQAMGDASNWWITASWDSVDALTWFVALGEPMMSLDFEKPRIVSTFYLVEAQDATAAACVADEVAKSISSGPYKLFVGAAEAPKGWSKTPLFGWSMRSSAYQQQAIEPGGTVTEVTVKLNDARKISANGGFLYCQLWNPNVPDRATHIVTSPNWILTITKGYQGTCWQYSGGDQTLLFQRFAQATNEVFLRDKRPVITKLFCGPDGGGPDGWATAMPNGWSCAAS